MTLFPKKYYIIFTKPAATGALKNKPKASAITVVYRKKDKDGKMKFYLDHSLSSRHLVTWFTAKWWMFLIQVFGRSNRKLFAYKFPNGTVYLRKANV